MMGVAMASDGVKGPSTVGGRITANPLKHLASLLREKLRDGGPCNLVQVATEIHAQAEDKHNTTMRRIYDVVNVCEGAGVLARTGHRSPDQPKKHLPASDSRIFPIRRAGKSTLRGGTEIQWLGGSSHNILGENGYTSQVSCQDLKLLLETEKGQTLDRISQKKRLCDTLSMQVAILQILLEQNQAQCRLYPDDSGTGFCTPYAMEQGSGNSEVASEIDTHVSSDVSTDLVPPQSPEGYCDVDDFICDYFVDEERPCETKRLYLPFVILATTPEANVNVYMTSCQVHLELDRNYRLMDHIHVIKMLPDRFNINNKLLRGAMRLWVNSSRGGAFDTSRASLIGTRSFAVNMLPPKRRRVLCGGGLEKNKSTSTCGKMQMFEHHVQVEAMDFSRRCCLLCRVQVSRKPKPCMEETDSAMASPTVRLLQFTWVRAGQGPALRLQYNSTCQPARIVPGN